MTPPLAGDYEPDTGASMLVADARMSMLSRAVFHMNRITKWHLSLTNCDYSDYRNVMLAALYRAALLTPGRISPRRFFSCCSCSQIRHIERFPPRPSLS